MNAVEASKAMRSGHAVARAGWGGYWELAPCGSLRICLYDGAVLGRSGESPIDWRVTMQHMQGDDFGIVDRMDTLHWYHRKRAGLWAGMAREAP